MVNPLLLQASRLQARGLRSHQAESGRHTEQTAAVQGRGCVGRGGTGWLRGGSVKHRAGGERDLRMDVEDLRV